MQLGKEYPTTERDSALYALLTCTRSFEPVRLRKHHILPASEFEDCSSEEIAMRKRMRHCSNVDGRVCRRSTLRFSASNWANTDYVKIAAMKFRWNGFKLTPCGVLF